MTAFYDLSGRLSFSVDDSQPQLARYVARQMNPFTAAPPPDGSADVVLAPGERLPSRPFRELQNPSHDALVTAADGERFAVLLDGLTCAVPDPLRDGTVEISYEDGFPIRRVFGSLVRPALQLALPPRGAVAVHAAAVELEGRAVLVAGWSESGKTETALALMESGARFLSDKWTLLGADGEASAFPINVGVRRWVLPYLPRLASSLPPAARAQMQAAGVAARASAPVRRRRGKGRLGSLVADLSDRAVGLADRAALTPEELRAAYGQSDDPGRRVPLGVVLLLTTVPAGEPTAEPADPAWAAARLARTAAYERRGFLSVLDRRRYAFPLEDHQPAEMAVHAERRLLEPLLADGRVVEVRAPFPVDPRTVAAAASRWL